MRMLLHNGTNTSDVKVFWQSSTCMKLAIRWPDFMTDARQLAGCLAQEDDHGKGSDPFKDENHPVCVAFGKNLEKIKDSSGDIH